MSQQLPFSGDVGGIKVIPPSFVQTCGVPSSQMQNGDEIILLVGRLDVALAPLHSLLQNAPDERG